MAAESLEDEVVRLRAEVESHRTRELAELRAALSTAQAEVAHFRAEAQRNADLGRQIAAGYQEQLTEARARLDAMRNSDAFRTRFANDASGNDSPTMGVRP